MNKTCVKVALALLSLAGYMQNVIFAIEPVANDCTNNSPICHMPLSLYEQYKDEVYDDVDEGLAAVYYAHDAKNLLLKLSEAGVHDYSINYTENGHKIYNKKIGNMDIGRLDFIIPSASKYSTVLRQYWDFKYDKNTDEKIIKGKVVRLYCKNTALFEKHNPDPNNTPLKKIYTLGSRIYLREMTVIVCPSRTLNYDGEVNKEIELKEVYGNQKSIETDIDPEEALNKLADNLSGFVIKHGDDDQVHVTYINAIYDTGNSTEFVHNKRERDLAYTNILNLAQHILSNE
ncbi:fam-a protein [Plasmodium chabaudi chabaudi]|uniref:Fam-a protein n=2 Tax=Plasmodium chabaudi chabaudi TaxID=31271 RepID=A0A4V0K1C4_PLACU|nr:fam-a protein [Plasmodium chabaudi chabaudi]VTZ66336.1 fam-a protein [Plasmodium chabaudi chabaudi]|eukprot:XP_016652888.1 fam-a protein [Plasmodium chabaudi chabaudi]